ALRAEGPALAEAHGEAGVVEGERGELAAEVALELARDAPALDGEPPGPLGRGAARALGRGLERGERFAAALRALELGRHLLAAADQVLDRAAVLPLEARELAEALLDGLEARGIRREAAEVSAERRAGILELGERRLEQAARRLEARVQPLRLGEPAERAAEVSNRRRVPGVDTGLRGSDQRREPLRVGETAPLRAERLLLARHEARPGALARLAAQQRDAGGAAPVNSASTAASSAPVRTRSPSGRPPSAASRAWRRIDFPAPVSPVMTFSPGSRISSSSSMMARSRTFSVRSIPCPSSATPAELGAQHVVVGAVRRADERDRRAATAHAHHVAAGEPPRLLAV